MQCRKLYRNIKDNIIMTHFAIKSLTVCLIYGVMSICQTLNSRYLYRNLGFDFYSFVLLDNICRSSEYKELQLSVHYIGK